MVARPGCIASQSVDDGHPHDGRSTASVIPIEQQTQARCDVKIEGKRVVVGVSVLVVAWDRRGQATLSSQIATETALGGFVVAIWRD